MCTKTTVKVLRRKSTERSVKSKQNHNIHNLCFRGLTIEYRLWEFLRVGKGMKDTWVVRSYGLKTRAVTSGRNLSTRHRSPPLYSLDLHEPSSTKTSREVGYSLSLTSYLWSRRSEQPTYWGVPESLKTSYLESTGIIISRYFTWKVTEKGVKQRQRVRGLLRRILVGDLFECDVKNKDPDETSLGLILYS